MTMIMKAETIQLLNIQLDLLLSNSEYFLNHVDEHQIDDLENYFSAIEWNIQSADHQRKSVTIAFYLIQELAFLVDSPTLALDEQYLVANQTQPANILLHQIYDRLLLSQQFMLPFQNDADLFDYRLINFLVAEIQLNVLLNRNAEAEGPDTESSDLPDTNAMEVDNSQTTSNADPVLQAKEQSELNQLTFQLDKICRLLAVNTDGLVDREEILYDIIETLKQLQTNSPAVYQQYISPQKIFNLPIPPLSSKQQELLRKIEQMTYQDFRVRRSMLLQRFDVTIQSFLNQDAAAAGTSGAAASGSSTAAASVTPATKKDSNEQIREAIQSQLQFLQNNPLYFQIEDAVDAPSALLLEHSQKVTNTPADSTSSSASKHRSIVKQVIIGKVPDRGGRVNELRPKRLDDFGGGGKSGSYKNHKAQHHNNNNNNNNNSNNNRGGGGGGGQKGGQSQKGSNSAAASTEESSGNSNNNHGRVVTVGKRADEDAANRHHNNFHHQRKKGKKDNN